ncbi:hypothetical protein [Rhodoferax sp. GW822-FHT02A01]|uniref:hypothetical protein n=1 Tax=Rhodoferax sp. GW822-FHT02A01 TaxID=3141537 RepID=UPI00315CDFEA
MSATINPVEATFLGCLQDVQAKVRASKARVETLTSEGRRSMEDATAKLTERDAENVRLTVLIAMEKLIAGGQQTIVADATAKLTTPDHKG